MREGTPMTRKTERPVSYVTIGKNQYFCVHFHKYCDKELIIWLMNEKLLLDAAPLAARKKLYRMMWREKDRAEYLKEVTKIRAVESIEVDE